MYHENKKSQKKVSSKSPTRAGHTKKKCVQDVEVKIESDRVSLGVLKFFN
jgi:hypothetical protein